MNATVARWSELLDEFESSLEAYVALAGAIRDHERDLPEQPRLEPLHGPGPVPEELRQRAQELTARSRVIVTELIRVRDDVAAELAALSRPTTVYHSPDTTSSRLDQVG